MEDEVQRAAVSSWNELDYEAEARLVAEARASWDRKARGEEEDEEDHDPEMTLDYYAYQAKKFRNTWNILYFGYFGRFEDTTRTPPMRFTEKPPPPDCPAYPRTTLQVPNLKLTGPSRAVLLVDPVTIEADLKVKGRTESEDKHLSFLAVPFLITIPLESCLRTRDFTSKLSTLRFGLAIVVLSVEATISVRVRGGSWPDGLRAQFAAHTVSIGREEVVLLDSGDDKLPVSDDGTITLGRRVASVEVSGELNVSVKAWQGGEVFTHRERGFKPKEAGWSYGTLDVGFCQMDVSVAWSLLSSYGENEAL
ncbi:hypothetical protein Zm00014a_017255 [Zea mays]|uniref:DUF6598 domain-containing protein n=1 Tax=Zea mays TaxID=4577 RepID=A0A3L6G658_MAIZE|nr:hypothetical protein Zm00014a_017255 [Zea mays]